MSTPLFSLPTPSFFSLTLAKREREEELSRTLNKGPTPSGQQAGFSLLAGLSPTPRHAISEPMPSLLDKAIAPRFSVRESPSSLLAFQPHLGLGPEVRAIRAGSIGWDMA